MPQRRVYFYRVSVGRDAHHRSIPFDAPVAFDEVGQLSFFDEDNGRYLDAGDGDLACCWVDRLRSPQQVRIARSRRRHLPPVERAGNLEDLEIPDDAGLAEQSFLVFFPNDVVGCIYNSFSPRVSVMRRYIRDRCSDNFQGVEFEPLLRQDALEKLERFQEVRLVELRILRSYRDQVERASPTLARALEAAEELAAAEQVTITLQPGPYGRGWLRRSLLTPLKRLARRRDLREGVTHFRVKGLDGESGTLDDIDVLKDQLVVFKDVELADMRSATLAAGSAYAAIEAAREELADHLERAAAVME